MKLSTVTGTGFALSCADAVQPRRKKQDHRADDGESAKDGVAMPECYAVLVEGEEGHFWYEFDQPGNSSA
jgi:hypothetical protein